MSDTPRTDEQINGKPCTRFEILAGDCLRNAAVPSGFARTLERELNEANERVRRLNQEINKALKRQEIMDKIIKSIHQEGQASQEVQVLINQHFWEVV